MMFFHPLTNSQFTAPPTAWRYVPSRPRCSCTPWSDAQNPSSWCLRLLVGQKNSGETQSESRFVQNRNGMGNCGTHRPVGNRRESVTRKKRPWRSLCPPASLTDWQSVKRPSQRYNNNNNTLFNNQSFFPQPY